MARMRKSLIQQRLHEWLTSEDADHSQYATGLLNKMDKVGSQSPCYHRLWDRILSTSVFLMTLLYFLHYKSNTLMVFIKTLHEFIA